MEEVAKIIEKWYKVEGRTFFWREKKLSPFNFLILEFLLWRTRAESVENYKFFIEYYSLERLIDTPLVEIENDIKELGLYKRRARLLKELGLHLQDEDIPKDQEKLEMIPGVGQYISRAILCFAFNLPCIPVDSNIKRILDRIFNFRIKNIRKLSKSEEVFLNKLILSADDYRDFSWALIDIGASICKKSPKCNICPLKDQCIYYSKECGRK